MKTTKEKWHNYNIIPIWVTSLCLSSLQISYVYENHKKAEINNISIIYLIERKLKTFPNIYLYIWKSVATMPRYSNNITNYWNYKNCFFFFVSSHLSVAITLVPTNQVNGVLIGWTLCIKNSYNAFINNFKWNPCVIYVLQISDQ